MKSLWLILLASFGIAVNVVGSEVVDLKLESKAKLHWYQGQYFKLCDETDTKCVQLKMPKAVTPIEKLDVTKNMDGSRATWLVISGDRTFVCAVADGSTQVNCGRVLSERTQASVKNKKQSTTFAKAMGETRKVLAAELKMARNHSVWWFWESACNECADRNDDINDDFSDCMNDAVDAQEDYMEDMCSADTSNYTGSVTTSGTSVSGGAQTSDTASSGCESQANSLYEKRESQCETDKKAAIANIQNDGLSGCKYNYF